MFDIGVFPADLMREWRTRGLVSRGDLEQAREALEKRRSLVLPPVPTKAEIQSSAALSAVVDAVEEDRMVPTPVLRECADLIRKMAWARWRHFEEAAGISVAGGDLITAALIVRTMMAEIGVLRKVCTALVAESPFGFSLAEEETRYLLRRRVLFATRELSMAEMVDSSDVAEESTLVPSELEERRNDLNEYVHFSYGSNLSVLYPERSRVGQRILAALTGLYELVHAEALLGTGPARESSNPSPAPYPENLRIIRATVLPSAMQGRQDDQAVRDFERLARGIDELRARHLGSLEDLPSATAAGWMRPGTTGLDALYLSEARMLWDSIEAWARTMSGKKRGDPPSTRSRVRTMLSYALASFYVGRIARELALRTTAAMVAGGNVVGAAAAARIAIEHHSVALRVGQLLDDRYDALCGDLENDRAEEPDLDPLEAVFVRHLGGSRKSTNENRPHLKDRARRLTGDVDELNSLIAIVESVFGEKHALRLIYHRLTRSLKGTQLSGGDLFVQGRNVVSSRVLILAIGVLTELGGTDSVLRLVATHHHVVQPLSDLLRATAAGEPLSESMRQQFDVDEFVDGRDVHGRGTADDPYRFTRGRSYHDNVRRFLQQIGKPGRRQIHHVPAAPGRLAQDRVVFSDGTSIHFEVPHDIHRLASTRAAHILSPDFS